MSGLILERESFKIIGACMTVFNTLGTGFLESVYQEALEKELAYKSSPYKAQWGIDIFYKDELLEKKFFADLLCFDKIIVELKAVETVNGSHEAQVNNYLKAAKLPVGLLVNFGGQRLEYKRFVNTN